MKNVFLKRVAIIAIAATMCMAANAQSGFGVQAGLNLSKFWGSDAPNSQIKPGIRLGIESLVEDPKLKNFFVSSVILFAQQGAKINGVFLGEEVNAEMTLNSFQYHINVRYPFNLGNDIGVFFQAGTYMGFTFSAKQKTEENGEWKSTKLKMGFFEEGKMSFLDAGLGFGAGVLVMKNFQVGVGYNFSFLPIVSSSDWVNMYNSNWSFTATYFFGKK